MDVCSFLLCYFVVAYIYRLLVGYENGVLVRSNIARRQKRNIN